MRRYILITITISQVFIQQSFAQFLPSAPSSLKTSKKVKKDIYPVQATEAYSTLPPQSAEFDNDILLMRIKTSQLFNLSSSDNKDNRILVEKRIPKKSRRRVKQFTTDVSRHREHKNFNKAANVANHFMEVWVGTPPQRMTMRVSTTSPYTVMGCGNSGTEVSNECASFSWSFFVTHIIFLTQSKPVLKAKSNV